MDKYWVYRPVLNLIGKSEGTAKGDGYNETLGYGAYTGGDVKLTAMTLDEVDALQTKMLRHPKNKWKSSAVGWFQIVRTTRRMIEERLGIPRSEKFSAEMQDRMACFLLGQRGIDKWIGGRMSFDTLLRNLSAEWASWPKPDGRGTYDGQHASITVAEARKALEETKRRAAAPVAEELDKIAKPAEKSTTNWVAVLQGLAGSIVTLLTGLHPVVQGLIIVAIIGGVGYIVYERQRKAGLAKAVMAKVGLV